MPHGVYLSSIGKIIVDLLPASDFKIQEEKKADMEEKEREKEKRRTSGRKKKEGREHMKRERGEEEDKY